MWANFIKNASRSCCIVVKSVSFCLFFCLTALLALLLLPYAIKCRKEQLIDSLKPAAYWKEFRIVLTFSLSIFTLSLFQVTATQSRPIILSIFSSNGAETVSEYRILEVIPQLIILIGGTFSGIFLPKVSEMVAQNNQQEIEHFAYRWTTLTTVLANILCIPFIFVLLRFCRLMWVLGMLTFLNG